MSRDIGPYVTDIATVCLETFSSDSWSVRNAGLQLLGGLSPRIVGQMKMKDDSQGYNNVSVLEIEARFPGLIEILVNKLENNVEAKSCLIEPCVVPILTILSRMETNISNSLSELINKCIRRFSARPEEKLHFWYILVIQLTRKNLNFPK